MGFPGFPDSGPCRGRGGLQQQLKKYWQKPAGNFLRATPEHQGPKGPCHTKNGVVIYYHHIERTPRGSCNRTLLRRVLRRFSQGSPFLEGFLRRRLVRVSVGAGVLRRVLRRGWCYRRRLERA